MLQNYFKVALRNIRKHKFYSILNISGLAFGLTACFLIGLYIYDELTFDHFHKDYEDIYHVGLHINFGGQEYVMASTCPPLASEMVNTIPGVEHATRINHWPLRNLVVKYEDKAFTEQKAFYADSNFFEFFNYKLLEGDIKTALKDPNSVVLTSALSTKYFSNESALGKIITIGNDKKAFKVTGVAEEVPANSHIQFEMLLSSVSDKGMRQGGWGDLGEAYVYFRKNRNTPLSSIELKLKDIIAKHEAPEIENFFGVSMKEFEKQGGIFTFFSYPLSSNHLYHPEIDGLAPTSDIKYVYIMGAVGLFILLIACINFMNLSTARAASRAKEVGLRKTLGSARSKLISQFLSESFIYVFTAMVIATAGVFFLMPSFNLLSGKALSFNTLLSPDILVAIAIIFVIVAMLAGSYPAFYLTSFNPIDVLKGNVRSGMKSKGIRSVLVVVQFTISIALMICTMVVYNQLHFMQERNIGMDKQNVLVLKNTMLLKNNQQVFLNELTKQNGIVKASYTSNNFPGIDMVGLYRAKGTTKDIAFPVYSADHNHLDVLKIELSQGRFFSDELASDSTVCVINEAVVREFGWTNPLNERLTGDGAGPGPGMNIIGVVKDFNFESLKTKVRPLVIVLRKDKSVCMLIRYSGNAKEAVGSVERTWKKFASNEPFEYSFLDENYDELFRGEQRLGQLFTTMSSIAIFVACLGLLGLASFTAEQRTKEIGIRKVMGASVASVNTMLSKEFMMLVGISFVIASALAWYAMKEWLSTFAYRIELGPIVFLLGGILAAGVAWLTVSYHFIKAARSNPVEALRCE
ncbi:MAG: ABC transporter permease [Chryseolinea sp.]